MAYVINEIENGNFECVDERTGERGRAATPEEALEALLAGQEGDCVEVDSDELSHAYDDGYDDGFRSGFNAAKEAIGAAIEDLDSDDFVEEIA